MNVQTPEPPGRFSFRLDVYSPSQVLQIVGRLYHLVLASLIAGEVTNSRAPSLRGYCSVSSLLRTHPPPSRRRSISRLSRLYDLPCSREKSPEQGRSYNRLNREIDRRREGGGWVRSSDETEQYPRSEGALLFVTSPAIREARTR